MSKKYSGDLTHVFETPVPNLDWLDVSEEDYRQLETLPKQNLDFVPDLVKAWSHQDRGEVRHVPNVDLDYVRETPKVSTEHMEDAKLRELVSVAVKERMMAGWDAARLASWVRENVHPSHINMLVPTLQRVANEYALLGHMTRTVEFDIVPTDNAAIDEYHARLDLPDSETEKDVLAGLDSFMSMELPDVRHNPRVPMQMGNQEDRDRRASGKYEPPVADFQTAHERSLYRDLSQKMMAAKGHLSTALNRRFARADSAAVAVLAQEANLLGSVYVRPDQFRNCNEANSFFRRHHNSAEHILEMEKCGGCIHNVNGSCSLIGKKVSKEIPYTEEVLLAEVRNLRDAGTLDKASAESILSRVGTDDVRDLIAEAHGVRAPQESVNYVAKYTTAQMQSTADVVAARTVETSSTLPVKHASVVREAYRVAYKGTHGTQLRDHLVERFGSQAVIEAGEHLRPIARMGGLLGNVVLDMRGFKTAEDASKYLYDNRKRPQFLLREGCGVGCGGNTPDYSRNFPGLNLIDFDSIGELELDSKAAVDALEMNERISTKRAAELRNRIGSTNDWDIVRDAYMSPRPAAKAGPERHARVAAPLVSRKQIDAQFRNAAEAEKMHVAKNLVALIDKQVDTDSIPMEFAANIRKHVESEDFDQKQVLRHLAEEEVRYAAQKQKQADEGWINHVQSLDVDIRNHGEIDVPAIDSSAVRKSQAARISSTQRTAFRQRVVMAMNRGLSGEKLQNWIRNSFEASLYNSEATFLRKALEDSGRGMGAHFIDPRPYVTCNTGAKQVAESPALYVQAMDKCSGCVFKSSTNRCQVYDREVVSEVPPIPAMEERIHTPTPIGIDPSVEYGLGSYLGVEIEEARGGVDLTIGYDDMLGDLK